MVINQLHELIVHPEKEWTAVRKSQQSLLKLYLGQIVWLAAIPAVSLWYGTTQQGWSLPGSDHTVRLTENSAGVMALFAWFAILAAVAVMGGFISWMARTFGTQITFTQGVTFTAYTTAPLFFAGLSGLYPSLWLAMIVATAAVSASVWLLYTGLPVFMKIPKERGFIYASSILCTALVVQVSIMVATVILWGVGFGPVYIQSY